MMPGVSSVANRGRYILIESGVLRSETEGNPISHCSGTSGDKCVSHAIFVYSYIVLSIHALIEGRPVEAEQERFVCLFVCLFVCDDEPVSVSSGIPHVDIEGGVVIYVA